MPESVNVEYRNQNSLRKYPFEDEASMTDTTGVVLPIDFLIDAFIYPIDLQGVIYIASIDLTTGRIHINDTKTEEECGYADFTDMSETAYVYDNELYQRQIGVLVFGDGLPELFQGQPIREFEPTATTFCPTTFIPMNQPGIRAFRLPDGTILTGNVVIEGQNGIEISTYTEGTKDIIYIDVVGEMPGDKQTDCGDCELITELCVERLPGSLFMTSQYTDDHKTIALSSYNLSLEAIRAQQRLQTLPDANGILPNHQKGTVKPDDPCGDDPTPPEPPEPGPYVFFCITVKDAKGNILITTPSGETFNPVYVLDLPGRGAQGQSKLPLTVAKTVSESQTMLEFLGHPPTFSDAIEIGVKGLSQFRRGSR